MKCCLLLLTLVLAFNGVAQTKMAPRIGVAYFGEVITHPGISLSYEKDFHRFETRSKEGGNAQKSKTLYYGLEVGAYHHNRALNAAFSQISIGFRKEGKKGGTWAFDMGNGYLLGSIPKVYTVVDGRVSKTRSTHHYTLHSLNFSFGRYAHWLSGAQWFVSPSFYITRPAFPKYTAHFAMRLGVKKTLK